MKAIVAREFGGPEVLRYEEVPDPEPGPGQAVVRIQAAGVNFGESHVYRHGSPDQLPLRFGFEGGGVVQAVGVGVTEVKSGDLVVSGGDIRNTMAKLALAHANLLVPVPPGLYMKLAVGVFMQGRTAHYLALDAYPIKRGDTVLIHSGAGGVGSLLTQVAKQRGAYVFTTVSTEEKARFAREIGADEVIIYRQQDFADAVLKATDGEGVTAVFDAVGKDAFEGNLRCVARGGHLLLYGDITGTPRPVDFAELLRRRGSIAIGKYSGADYRRTPEEMRRRAADLFRWVREGELRVHIHKEYPLSEAAQAYRDIESGANIGKILLIP